jgi:hypothetical protein
MWQSVSGTYLFRGNKIYVEIFGHFSIVWERNPQL